MSATAEVSNAIPLLAGIAAPFILLYIVLFCKLRRKLARVNQTAAQAEHNAELVQGFRAEHCEQLAELRGEATRAAHL